MDEPVGSGEIVYFSRRKVFPVASSAPLPPFSPGEKGFSSSDVEQRISEFFPHFRVSPRLEAAFHVM